MMWLKRLSVLLAVLTVVTAQLVLIACDSAQSRAKKIVSLRAASKRIADKLYQEYGGSDLSKTINANLQNGQGASNTPENQVTQGIVNLTQGVDRSIFEQTLRTVGSGEQQIFVTEKAKQFFSRQDVIKEARKICEIELELAELESRQNR